MTHLLTNGILTVSGLFFTDQCVGLGLNAVFALYGNSVGAPIIVSHCCCSQSVLWRFGKRSH